MSAYRPSESSQICRRNIGTTYGVETIFTSAGSGGGRRAPPRLRPPTSPCALPFGPIFVSGITFFHEVSTMTNS